MSKEFSLNKKDFSKIGTGLWIAIGGAAITYLLEILPQIDFGDSYTPIVVAIASIGLNTARKYLSKTK